MDFNTLPAQATAEPTQADWLDYEAWLDTLPPGWPTEDEAPAPIGDADDFEDWLDRREIRAYIAGIDRGQAMGATSAIDAAWSAGWDAGWDAAMREVRRLADATTSRWEVRHVG